MSYSNRSKTLAAWLTAFLILSMGLNAYLWFQNSQQKTDIATKQNEFFELEKINTELEQDYQAALDNLEGMRGDNKELNAKIDKQKADLKSQKAKISDLIWTKRELNTAREELASLRAESSRNLAELTELKQKYEVVAAKALKLEGEKTQLVQQVSQQIAANEELTQIKTKLVSETESLKDSNMNLSGKVEMAEAIKINFIEVQGYDVKDDGNLKKQSRTKKLDMLRTCFRTETNLVTPPGEEEFFIRIIDPAGSTLAVEDSGSGSLTNKLDNSQVRYTVAGTLQYDNKDTEGCIDWTPGYRLNKGVYQIEMYNNSYIVGKGSFKLK